MKFERQAFDPRYDCSHAVLWYRVPRHRSPRQLRIIENRLDTKNLLVTEKYYDESTPFHTVLNAAENLKTDIRNIYSNCIPFYNIILSGVQNADLQMLNFSDRVLQTLLYAGDELADSAHTLESTHDETAADGSAGTVVVK